MIDPTHPGLKKHRMTTSTVVFMIFCLCAAGAYGIEDMIPNAGPGLTLVMLILLPFVWSTPMGLVASELGSAIPEEGGFYKWVQRACGEFWGFQAGWWRTIRHQGRRGGEHGHLHPRHDCLRDGRRLRFRELA